MRINLQQKLNEIVENVPLGLILVSPEGQIDIVNATAKQIINLSEKKITGKSIDQVLPTLCIAIQECLEKGFHSYGHVFEGIESNVVIDLLPLNYTNQKNGILLIVKPSAWISGKIVEEQNKLEKVSEELELILNSSFDGIWLCDNEGIVQRINKASEKINSLQSDQVIGRKMEELIAEGIVDRSVTLAVIKSEQSETFIQHLKNGKKLLATGNPVFDSSGKLIWVVVNERDITDLSQLQIELQESRKIIQDYRTEINFLTTEDHHFSTAIIRNEKMIRVLNVAMRASKVDSSVLLQGESGVGKAALAKQIHQASPRKEGPFLQTNCSSIPESQFRKELFGEEDLSHESDCQEKGRLIVPQY